MPPTVLTEEEYEQLKAILDGPGLDNRYAFNGHMIGAARVRPEVAEEVRAFVRNVESHRVPYRANLAQRQLEKLQKEAK